MNTKSEIISRLKVLIAEELDVNIKVEQIQDDAVFFEGGLGIDSIAIVELISLVEEEFGLQFSDDDLVPESFANLGALANLVEKRLALSA